MSAELTSSHKKCGQEKKLCIVTRFFTTCGPTLTEKFHFEITSPAQWKLIRSFFLYFVCLTVFICLYCTCVRQEKVFELLTNTRTKIEGFQTQISK